METNYNYEDAALLESVIGFEALYESMLKCKKNVIWKDSVAHFHLNGIEQTLKLEKELKDGTYTARPPKEFTITYPKKREAVSISFRDRVYQRSMNDNVIYPLMSRQFIFDNLACQEGKGTDLARARLEEFLHKFYRKHGTSGYVLKCDIHGYYPNMRHDVAEACFAKRLPPAIYERTERVLREQYKGEVVKLVSSEAVKRNRKKLFRMVQKVKRGEMAKSKVDECFKCQLDHLRKGNSFKLLQRYCAYYKSLWR